MKKLLMIALATALFAVPAMAQKDKDKAAWEAKVKSELQLTPEQTTKYDAIADQYKTSMKSVESDASLAADAKEQKLMDMKKEKMAKINAMLTPEQQTKFKELMEKKKDKMKKDKS